MAARDLERARKRKRGAVRKALVQELKLRGAENAANLALIEDYMNYYDLEAAATEDVRTRGTSYAAISATGKEYDKDNPNVKLQLEYNKRKLDILKTLGLNEPTEPPEQEDEL